jgi:hypothetical protein
MFMPRWFDCPCCLGYCEENEENYCVYCGEDVMFEPAPEELKTQLCRAGLWCEWVVVVFDDDELKSAPAFANQEEYDKYNAWNSMRLRAACDQLNSIFRDGDDEETSSSEAR